MKNIIYILLLLINLNILKAQEFIINNNYVYGEGFGNTIEEADKNALNSLANSIKVNVQSYSEYNIHMNEYDVKKTYSERILTFTNIIIKDSHIKIIKTSDDCFKIYRYIDKKAYVEERLNKINDILYKHKNYARTINLMLGEYYYAYKIYDDQLMALFYPQSIPKKEELKKKAINLQKCISVEETSKLYFNIRNESIPLYGIDYQSIDNECFDLNNFYFRVIGPYAYGANIEIYIGNKWSKNYSKSIENYSCPLYRVKCDLSLPRNKFSKSKNILLYRVTFEIIDDFNNKLEINVPNDWYFVNNIVMASPNDVIEWINNDVERKFITPQKAEIYKNYLFN